jgi:two-component system chemotaxis response regulator CheB
MPSDIGVLIVDDSSLVRRALARELNRQSGIRVLGTAPDAFIAREKILKLHPDVITLDIQMPRMDGLTFLRKLMKHHPIPTIVISSLTGQGCQAAVACLEAGAVDVVTKPDDTCSIGDLGRQLADIIRAAAGARLQATQSANDAMRPHTDVSPPAVSNTVVAIGTSTGGTEALRFVLTGLPARCPGIVMVQHMPAGFTAAFAERLNGLCQIEVREAKNGDGVTPGVALLAPGDRHMRLVRDGVRYLVRVCDGPRVCRHRPSVEVLFESTAECAGRNSLGIIMTGMGNDGAYGLLSMRKAGAMTIAQNEESCVVFGMPKEAIECGGAALVSPLDQMSQHIVSFAGGKLRPNKSDAA